MVIQWCFSAGILRLLTILNLFWGYLTSLLYCFNAFFMKYLYKMNCISSTTHRDWIQPCLPEASWECGAWKSHLGHRLRGIWDEDTVVLKMLLAFLSSLQQPMKIITLN